MNFIYHAKASLNVVSHKELKIILYFKEISFLMKICDFLSEEASRNCFNILIS